MPGSPPWTPVNGVYRVSELKERTDADPKWTEFDDNYIGTNAAFIFEYLNTNPTNLNHDYEVTAGGHHIGGVRFMTRQILYDWLSDMPNINPILPVTGEDSICGGRNPKYFPPK